MKFVWSRNHHSGAYVDAYDSQRGEIASFGDTKLNLQHIIKTSSPNEFHKPEKNGMTRSLGSGAKLTRGARHGRFLEGRCLAVYLPSGLGAQQDASLRRLLPTLSRIPLFLIVRLFCGCFADVEEPLNPSEASVPACQCSSRSWPLFCFRCRSTNAAGRSDCGQRRPCTDLRIPPR